MFVGRIKWTTKRRTAYGQVRSRVERTHLKTPGKRGEIWSSLVTRAFVRWKVSPWRCGSTRDEKLNTPHDTSSSCRACHRTLLTLSRWTTGTTSATMPSPVFPSPSLNEFTKWVDKKSLRVCKEIGHAVPPPLPSPQVGCMYCHFAAFKFLHMHKKCFYSRNTSQKCYTLWAKTSIRKFWGFMTKHFWSQYQVILGGW